MTIRVESDEDINRGVAKTMFDHQEVQVEGRDYEYNYNFEDGKNAVRNHIANVPKPNDPLWDEDPKQYSYPVVIPHDEDVEWPITSHPERDNYGWDIFKVVDDILNYKKTESKRGARAIANHIRAHARLNYHSRDTMDINGVTHIVADPQDVGNVLAYRDLLLAATHDINEQKLAVIEALTDEDNGVGAPGPNGGLQAPHKDIRAYIDEYSDITSMSKSQLTNQRDQGVLDQMEEDYLIEVHEGEGENGAHLYEFLGGSTFGHPNLDVYDDLFEHVSDPIRDQPIRTTVEDFKNSLSVKTSQDLLSEDPMDAISPTADDSESSGGSEATGESLSDFGGGDDGEDMEWNEVDEAVAERLRETLDDKRATPQDVQSLDLQHMLGVSPVEVYSDDRGIPYVRAERPREDADRKGTIMDSSHALWGDKSDQQVESIIENTVAKLRKHDVFEVVVDEPDNPENDDKYIMVSDLE
jgi:HPt (histidine-containing phosphotransfer) domain-containing protein